MTVTVNLFLMKRELQARGADYQRAGLSGSNVSYITDWMLSPPHFCMLIDTYTR